MKFYTLDFDCNAPMTQQVNVPTNTDYKVGIKVKRNGEIQNLGPSSVKLGTLSADADKTNGYVTFTLSAGDSASYTQATLDIQHRFDDSVIEYNTIQNTASGNMTLNGNVLSATAEELGLAGKTVDAENFYLAQLRNLSAAATEAELKAAMQNPFYTEDISFQQRTPLKKANGGFILITTGATRELYKETAKEKGWKESDGAFFLYSPDSTGENWYPAKTYTFEPTDIISLGWGKLGPGKYTSCGIECNFGTPFDAKFKLNTNIFKSQQGDIDVVGTQASGTVTLAGEYADGTEFSYELLLK